MVYKIRNKGFFQTMGGFKNNYHVKVLNDVIEAKPDITYTIKTWEGGPQLIRYYQLYRNISRRCKQYMYGDRELENNLILWIRKQFKIPLVCETPIHLIQSEPDRRFASQGDRDYELISHNTHPFQLAGYRSINEDLQEYTQSEEIRNSGEKPLEDQMIEVFEAKFKQHQNSSKPKWDLMREILEEVVTEYKIAEGAKMARNSTGSINDFADVRRPDANSSVLNSNVKTN